jgi:TPR repeat protein
MKRFFSFFVFLLMLRVATAQQTNIMSSVTNNEAFEALKTKAENGDAIAQYNLGYSYAKG